MTHEKVHLYFSIISMVVVLVYLNLQYIILASFITVEFLHKIISSEFFNKLNVTDDVKREIILASKSRI